MYFYYVCILIVCLCIFILPAGTLRLPWLWFFRAFFLSCKVNARVNPQRQGNSNDIGNWTRDLTACRAVFQFSAFYAIQVPAGSDKWHWSEKKNNVYWIWKKYIEKIRTGLNWMRAWIRRMAFDFVIKRALRSIYQQHCRSKPTHILLTVLVDGD
jgi:hypothetical protein